MTSGNCMLGIVVEGSRKNSDTTTTNNNEKSDSTTTTSTLNPIISAGDTIVGYIYCSITKAPIPATQLVVTLSGQERTYVQYTTTHKDTNGTERSETHHAYGNRNIINLSIPIECPNEMLHSDYPPITTNHHTNNTTVVYPGDYKIPFTIQLHTSLPPSFYVAASYGGYAEVKYTLGAELKGSGVLYNYSSSVQDLPLYGRVLDTELIPHYVPPTKETIYFCCCIPRGTMSFAASITDTQLDKGENCIINFSLHNDSIVTIDSIDAELIETIRWNANGHSGYIPAITLQHMDFPNYTDDNLRGVASLNPNTASNKVDDDGNMIFSNNNNNTTTNDRTAMNNNNNVLSSRQICLRDLESGKHTGTMMVPYRAHTTYQGSLITISHEIVLRVNVSGCGSCCLTTPYLHIPVLIGEPRPGGSNNNTNQQSPPKPSAPPTLPDNFNPITTSPIAVSNHNAILGGTSSGTSKPGTTATAPTEPDECEIVLGPSLYDYDTIEPSVVGLLKEMENSLLDWDIIENKLSNRKWDRIFQTLTPTDYGKIIHAVDSSFDQPKVAVAVAAVIRNFTCAHAVAAITKPGSTSSSSSANDGTDPDYWNRGTIVEKIIPYITDLSMNQKILTSPLSDWELTYIQPKINTAIIQQQRR